ncbi:DUF1361 domain-containing protein [Peptoniphilus catoniae]|uniref:DUF1361 domain-containing protein n=1 Tax=Peptoniphilus catoniae TaxID=1660341 RepID=UPI0010FDE1B1|nr:DUF1361 domain-containing protein [Peptoniphilus catoniae]
MNNSSVKNLKKIIIYIIFYIGLSGIIVYFNLNRYYLIYNGGLSFVAYILSNFAKIKKSVLITILSFLATLAFYPNCIYMFTDFIHINTANYYVIKSAGKVSYNMNYLNWIKLAVDTGMITLSMVLAFETFINILKTIKCYGYKFAELIILVLMSLITGVALYIGRFLRFNSWDVFKLVEIVTKVMEDISINDYYLIATFAGIHFFIILLFANLKSE